MTDALLCLMLYKKFYRVGENLLVQPNPFNKPASQNPKLVRILKIEFR